MAQVREYYLAKSGEIFGPYSPEQFQDLLNTGALLKFSWFWDTEQSEWKPIDPAPVTSPLNKEKPLTSGAKAASRIEALCFDGVSVASGRLDRITALGCDFIEAHGEVSPRFALNSSVTLDLLDPESGRSMSVRARLVAAAASEGRWRYQLQWPECPALCARAAG